MNAHEFVAFFRKIRPTYDELKRLDPTLPDSVIKELQREYDLELTVIIDPQKEVKILDLLNNSNITQLHFNEFSFENAPQEGEFIRICSIDEKGVILLKVSDGLYYFFDERRDANQMSKFGIEDSDFLTSFCMYTKLRFDKTFRSIEVPSNKKIEMREAVFQGKCLEVFVELMQELYDER